ncbi:hypothetical protein P7C71_g306, partial [Lecanoromycetidae sp. Uapishka_2]
MDMIRNQGIEKNSTDTDAASTPSQRLRNACRLAALKLSLGPTETQDLVVASMKLLTVLREPFTLPVLSQALLLCADLAAGTEYLKLEELDALLHSVCHLMIGIFQAKDAPAFAHEDVPKLFITLLEAQTDDEEVLSKFKIDYRKAHKNLAICCIRTLQEAIYEEDFEGNISAGSAHPAMFQYAGKYWVDHVLESGSTTVDILEAVANFLDKNTGAWWLRHRLEEQDAGKLTATIDQLLILEHRIHTWAALAFPDISLRPPGAARLLPVLFERYLDDLKSWLTTKDIRIRRASDMFGQILTCKGDYMQASTVLQETFQMRQAMNREHSLPAMSTLLHLARVLMRQGKWEAAEASLRIVLQREETVLGLNHPDTMSSQLCLAEILIANKDGVLNKTANQVLEEAEAITEKVNEVLSTRRKKNYFHITDCARVAAKLLAAQGSDIAAQQAVDAYLHHQSLARKTYGHESRTVLSSRNELGAVYQTMGILPEAEATLRDVLKTQKRTLDEAHPDINDTALNLALLWEEQGDDDLAEFTYDWLIPRNENTYGKHHRYTLEPLYRMARIFIAQGQTSEATPLLERVIAKPDPGSVKTSQLQLKAANDLMEIYEDDGKEQEIVALHEKIEIIQGKTSEGLDVKVQALLLDASRQRP